MSKNAFTNFRSFPYLDFELSFRPVDKTVDFAILSNQSQNLSVLSNVLESRLFCSESVVFHTVQQLTEPRQVYHFNY